MRCLCMLSNATASVSWTASRTAFTVLDHLHSTCCEFRQWSVFLWHHASSLFIPTPYLLYYIQKKKQQEWLKLHQAWVFETEKTDPGISHSHNKWCCHILWGSLKWARSLHTSHSCATHETCKKGCWLSTTILSHTASLRVAKIHDKSLFSYYYSQNIITLLEIC